jgi:hypothetical protein
MYVHNMNQEKSAHALSKKEKKEKSAHDAICGLISEADPTKS